MIVRYAAKIQDNTTMPLGNDMHGVKCKGFIDCWMGTEQVYVLLGVFNAPLFLIYGNKTIKLERRHLGVAVPSYYSKEGS